MTCPPTNDERTEIWSRYWSQLAAHGTTAGSLAGGYEGTAIGHWWRARIVELEGRRRWLDVATGNGALPLIWSRCNVDPQARCDAVDLARIAVPWTAQLPPVLTQRLHWHAGVSAEDLPFETGCIDVAMSQYGFEYARRGEAIDELARVLRSGGALRLVMHHAGGRPAQLAKTEIGHIDELLAEDGLWCLACLLVEPFSRAGTPQGRAALSADPAMEALRQAFNRAQRRASESARGSACPDVLHEANDAVAALLERVTTRGAEAASDFARAWTAQLEDSRRRLAELRDHALDPTSLEELRHRLDTAFCDCHCEQLHDGEHCMAWALTATRR
jgi:SAM-dependent methyltransferase